MTYGLDSFNCADFGVVHTNGGMDRILFCQRKLEARARLPFWKWLVTLPFADVTCHGRCPSYLKERCR